MGSQTPSVRIAPDYAYTDGADAVKVLAVGKLIVDPWQSEVLNDWMGSRFFSHKMLLQKALHFPSVIIQNKISFHYK